MECQKLPVEFQGCLLSVCNTGKTKIIKPTSLMGFTSRFLVLNFETTEAKLTLDDVHELVSPFGRIVNVRIGLTLP
jgi:hypothetical protein